MRDLLIFLFQELFPGGYYLANPGPEFAIPLNLTSFLRY